ncbi:PQQ-dependent sugar dehydrogenase [Pseudoxanthomonas sp. CAU 1598]|uniref:PQQ-dependent sugar dehydrogenase n=2 Tax=Pseudomarimonas arenosa TaxID=2774145 RepID=A0AAW3ZM51_9GAMM|nr:PQQ-dependent sugar dehydrogenase [Pseudomarimonas arenosa]
MVILGLSVGGAAVQAGEVTPDLRLETVVSGFVLPVAVRNAGDSRLFVVEQNGRIRVVSGGTVLATPFLDFTANAPATGFTGQSSASERGLLGLAFAPDYATSGLFYVNYTDGQGDTVIARYQVSGDPDVANPASAAIVLRIDQDFTNHNGGDLHFGPDGYLYIGMGDGGSSNDPCNRGQTLLTASLNNAGSCAVDAGFLGNGGQSESRALLGKLLRIDVSTAGSETERCGLATGSVGYSIPLDNPYAGTDGVCDEVFASGLRNPWRFSFDRLTGDIWIADVGQGAREEVDVLPAGQVGLNFGWRCREGFLATGLSGCGSPPPFTDPVLDYDRSFGQSITGGYRYRGPQQPLDGVYFFADFASGLHMAAIERSSGYQRVDWRDSGGNFSSFGEDQDGELYVLNYGAGSLQRLVTDTRFRGDFESESAF